MWVNDHFGDKKVSVYWFQPIILVELASIDYSLRKNPGAVLGDSVALDKRGIVVNRLQDSSTYQGVSGKYFSYFSTKIYVVGTP